MAIAQVLPVADLAEWVSAIMSLPAVGNLPARTVIVPSEPHAHALRRELVVRAPHVLAGTRFLTLVAVARAVLDAAGIGYRAEEEQFLSVPRGLRCRCR